MLVVSKVAVPASGEVTTIVKLPPGTHNADFAVESGSFYCKSVTLSADNGSKTYVFSNSDMPVKFHETMGGGGSKTFVAANINCRGGSTAAQLVVAASP